jgi:hypothetical protein
MTYDITIYIPGKESATYRDRDQAFVDRINEQAKDHDNWKVTVCEHATTGNGRYH